jgi:hypothetical protein
MVPNSHLPGRVRGFGVWVVVCGYCKNRLVGRVGKLRFLASVGATDALWETRRRAWARPTTRVAQTVIVVISTAHGDELQRLLESD